MSPKNENVPKSFRVIIAGLLIALFLVCGNQSAGADNVQIDGITVSPAIIHLNLKENQAAKPIVFKVTNSRPVAQTLSLSTADFNALEDTGGLLFVGANPTELQKKYGLAKWLQLRETSLKLGPGQTAEVHATIVNRKDMAGGGHYGALMLAIDKGGAPAASNNVGLHPIASVLMFVNKIGGDFHALNLAKVDAAGNVLSLPSDIKLYFLNTGNTDITPRGTVRIMEGGRLISRGVINQDSNVILPGLTREFSVHLTQQKLPLWPGHYRLIVNYRFDGFADFKTYQQSLFLVVPQGFALLVGFSALIALLFPGPRQAVLRRLKIKARA